MKRFERRGILGLGCWRTTKPTTMQFSKENNNSKLIFEDTII